MSTLKLFVLFVGFSLPNLVFAEDCVIFVHGLGRTHKSLGLISYQISRLGFHVVNKSYPSRHDTIESLTEKYIPKWVTSCEGKERIHFVTHSMGGIMVRYYLEKIARPENLGHVVMMAPPNHGSPLVNQFGSLSSYILGPANEQLGTGPDSLPNQLGPADYSLGIIAGSETANPISHLSFSEPNDGKVTVESSKLEGMAAHIVLPYSHTFMMNQHEVINSVIYFLFKGVFETQPLPVEADPYP